MSSLERRPQKGDDGELRRWHVVFLRPPLSALPLRLMSDDLNDALEAQQWLLESSLPLVFEAYDDAIQRKVVDPVVVLLDCEDAIGGEIARSWLGEETVEDAILHQSDDLDDA